MKTKYKAVFVYPKDEKGQPLRSVVCVITVDDKLYQGTAYCSKSDEYVKSVGREIAYNRAVEAYEKWNSNCKKKSTKKPKAKVAHYLEVVDKKKYPNHESSIHKLSTISNKEGNKVITALPSELDSKWSKPGKYFLSVEDNGYGFRVKANDKDYSMYNYSTDFYLDYCSAAYLQQILEKYHKIRYYSFKRIKKG